MQQAERAGLPLKMALPEGELEDRGGDFPHYIGQRREAVGGARVIRVEANGTRSPLPPRNDLHNHSPDGFNWGYAGSGAAQLALAICADILRDDHLALSLYQEFKRRLIANLTADRWTLTANDIRPILDEIREAAHA